VEHAKFGIGRDAKLAGLEIDRGVGDAFQLVLRVDRVEDTLGDVRRVSDQGPFEGADLGVTRRPVEKVEPAEEALVADPLPLVGFERTGELARVDVAQGLEVRDGGRDFGD
jgi:hypothetical protein